MEHRIAFGDEQLRLLPAATIMAKAIGRGDVVLSTR
jgi:hypothetical protein